MAYDISHTYDSAGTYTVTLTAIGTNGCSSLANYQLVISGNSCELTGINDSEVNDLSVFKIFPNPIETSNPENFAIQYELKTEAEISCILYDIAGRKVAELINKQHQSRGKYFLKSSSCIEAGVYFIALQINGKSIVQRLVVYN